MKNLIVQKIKLDKLIPINPLILQVITAIVFYTLAYILPNQSWEYWLLFDVLALFLILDILVNWIIGGWSYFFPDSDIDKIVKQGQRRYRK